MSTNKTIKIGLFGFGCVGTGIYEVLKKTTSLKAEITQICVKNRHKKRNAPQKLFTYDPDRILGCPEINVVVELIDDAEAAFTIVSQALKNGKAVVTANKKMIAEHFEELITLQKTYNVPLLYEAACCASIPVIRNLEEYYDNDLLQSVEGIINGSTNYILSSIFKNKKDFAQALYEAQLQSFAESNPSLDVEGFDAKFKLTLLLAHAFGLVAKPEQIFNLGIQKLTDLETLYATEKNATIKLIARTFRINDYEIGAFVLPQFVSQKSRFYEVQNEYNGVQIEGCFADKQFFEGKGAGSFPTASAVLSDISALRYDYKYEYRKLQQNTDFVLSNDFYVQVFVKYTHKNDVPFEDFLDITEQYTSPQAHYLIGKIHFETLKNAAWLHKKGVSLVLTENWRVEDTEENVSTQEHALAFV